MAPDRPSLTRLVSAALAMTGVMLLVAALGEWVLIPSATVRELDEGGVARGTELLTRVDGLQPAAETWALLSGPWVVHPLVLLVAAVLLARGRVGPRAVLVVPVGLVGWGLEVVCKGIVERPRPAQAAMDVGGWSYPSGHATNAALGAVLLIALVTVVRSAWIRWGTTIVVLVAVVLTVADRLVLGVHYPTDVLMGLVLGAVMGVVGLRLCSPFAGS